MSTSCQCGRPAQDGYACHRCANDAKRHLERIPGLAWQLERAVTRQTAFGPQFRDFITGTTGQPLPLDWDASIIAGALRHTLVSWTLLVATEASQSTPVDDQPKTLAPWLWRRVPWLRNQRYGPEFFDELGAIIDRCQQAIDAPPNRAAFNVGPCPRYIDDAPCPGWVRAIIPDANPAYMACIECEARWETWQWRRAGKRILERRTLGA